MSAGCLIIALFFGIITKSVMTSTSMVDRVTTGFVLNYSGHPVLPGQKLEIEKLMYWTSCDVINVMFGNVPEDHNFATTIIQAVEGTSLSPEEWQTTPLVVIPPGYSAIWSVVLAELHGRLGYFPDVVRLRPAPSGSAEKFEVAEILNLGEIRHLSRHKR